MTKRTDKKKELQVEFERIQGEKFVRGIMNYPDPSWFEFVELKTSK